MVIDWNPAAGAAACRQFRVEGEGSGSRGSLVAQRLIRSFGVFQALESVPSMGPLVACDGCALTA